jgi:tripartite-type tricarboxylate transporter receptor subunit TctC
VLVENRPGAGGNVGMDVVARAAPDGYTMGLGAAGALAANVSLYAKMPYDPLKDFAPVSNVAFVPFLLVANPSLPANNLRELVALASAKPGELMLGYGGNGTAMHLSGELFKLMAKVQLTNVPYKGSGPAALDVVGGQLPLAMVDVASAITQMKAGRLKALAVTTAKRISAAPEVPTFAESGLPGYESTGWFGVVMPAGTPNEIVGRMNTELVAALKRLDMRERVIAAGAEPSPSTPEEFGALIRSEIEKWAEVVKISGAKPD